MFDLFIRKNVCTFAYKLHKVKLVSQSLTLKGHGNGFVQKPRNLD